MKCPHCNQGIHMDETQYSLSKVGGENWYFSRTTCPECDEAIIFLGSDHRPIFMAFPQNIIRPIPNEVPPGFAEDYKEAATILPNSAKASAALSRRCLQLILEKHLKVKPQELSYEITEVIAMPDVPTPVKEALEPIRKIGNLGAHATEDKNSGTIIPVEQGEAEWNLDALDILFDFIFVQPAILQKRKIAFNEKLKAAGKPLLKL